MLIYELIENLRRFPQDAKVFNSETLFVEATPHVDDVGNTLFDANCDSDDLPETLRKAIRND